MSTRSSRRSTGGASSGPAPSVIPLLPAARLRTELRNRGLDATGPQHVLSDRLLQAVEMERLGITPPNSSEPEKKKPKREPERERELQKKEKQKEKLEESPSEVPVEKQPEESPAQHPAVEKEKVKVLKRKLTGTASPNVTPPPVQSISLPVRTAPAKSSSVDISDTIPSNQEQPTSQKPATKINQDQQLRNELRNRGMDATGPQHELSDRLVRTVELERLGNTPSSDEREGEVQKKKLKMKVKLPKSPSEVPLEKHPQKSPAQAPLEKEIGDSDRLPLAVELERRPGVIPSSSEPEKKKRKRERERERELQKKEKHKEKLQKSPSGVALDRQSQKSPAQHPVVEKEKVKVLKRKLTGTASPNVTPAPAQSISLPVRTAPVKSSSLDIFDTILSNQDQLFTSVFKSSETKLTEQRNIELSKRRLSSAVGAGSSSSPTPSSIDKRKALSIDVSFNTPSGQSTPQSIDSATARSVRFSETEKNETPPLKSEPSKLESAEPSTSDDLRLPPPPLPPCDLLPPPPPPPMLTADTEIPEPSKEPEKVEEIVMEAVTPDDGFEPTTAAAASPFEGLASPSPETIASAMAPVEAVTERKIETAVVKTEPVQNADHPEPYVPEDVPAAPESVTPSVDLIKSVASILQNLYKKKLGEQQKDPYAEDARVVMNDLLDRVEQLDTSTCEKENDIMDPVLMSDPRELVKRASDVLSSMEKTVKEEVVEYIQELPEPGEVEHLTDVPKEVEFHGEPVPDSDPEDGDALFAAAAGLPVKKAEKKKIVMPDEDDPIGDSEFELDYFNADFHVKGAADDKSIIDPDVSDGFALMYGGVKTNYGFLIKDEQQAFAGRYAFQVKIVERLSIKHVPFEEEMPYDMRVGWSMDSGASTMHVLGEAENSFAYDSQGRKIQNFSFKEFGGGEHLDVGDVVTTVLDLKNRSIDYYRNDTQLGTAFSDLQLPQGQAIFPHVATKNCKIAVNFGKLFGTDVWRKPRSLVDEPTWLCDVECSGDLVVRSRAAPESKGHCTVLMMVGLPAVGKTTWVRNYLRDHPEEHWIVLSTDAVSSSMTLNGMPRRRAHRGRWDMVMGLIAKAVNRSLHMACRRKHNYIIDMTNVSRDTRRRRLTQFKDFQRKCVVLIPSDEDFNKRQQKQARMEGTAPIPPEAMLELKAAMSIPNQDLEPIEDVVFIEPPVERVMDAIKIVTVYNEEARPWFQKKYQKNRRGGGGGSFGGSYGERRKDKDDDYHRPPPQKVVITQHIRLNDITSRPRYDQT